MSSLLTMLTLAALSTPAAASPSIGDAPTYRECRAQYNSDKAQCFADFPNPDQAAQYTACMQAATAAFKACLSQVRKAETRDSTDGMTATVERLESDTADFVLIDTDGARTFLGNVDVDADGTAELILGHDRVVREVLADGGHIVVE